MDYTKDVTLKKLIAKRIKDNDINVVILCKNASVKYNTFVMWMNSKKSYGIGHEHFEERLIRKICKQLHISVRVQYIQHNRTYEDFKFLRDGRVNRRKERVTEEIEYLREEVKKLEDVE